MAKQKTAKVVPTVQLSARTAADSGTGACRRMRQRGLVPAVIYGRGTESTSAFFHVDEYKTLQRNNQTHGLLRMAIGENTESGIIKDVQWDTFMEHMLHVDFQRVQLGEIMTVEVHIELRGTAPGAAHGGIVGLLLHEIEIQCPVESIPDSIEVNIGSLEIGGEIRIGNLELPESCKATGDPDQIVVHVTKAMTEEELEQAMAAASGEGGQPKVIGEEEAAEGEDE